MFIEARVDTLAALLKAIRPFDTHASEARKAADEADATWAASQFLAELFSVCRLSVAPLDEARASQLVGKDVLEDLLKRYLVRSVLGRLVIPAGVSMALHRGTEIHFAKSDTHSLRKLRDEAYAVDRAQRVISADDFARLHSLHSAVFRGMPSMSDLQQSGAIEQDVTEVHLNLRAQTWSVVVGRAGARSWERRPTSASPRAALLSWLDLMGASEWTASPHEMISSHREAWLDAALDLVLAEPDLMGWDREGERLKPESDYAGWTLSHPLPSADSTAAQRYRWWFEVHHDESELRGRDESRSSVLALVAAIVRADSLEGAYTKRASRIRRLIEAGATRPALSYHVPRLLVRLRPEALAWLLVDKGSAALALNMIQEVQHRDQSIWGTVDEHTDRMFERQVPLARDAFAIFFGYLGRLPMGAQPTTDTVLDVLVPLARRSCAISPSSHPSQHRERDKALAFLDIGLEEFEHSLVEARMVRSGAAYHPPLVNALAETLLRSLIRIATDPTVQDFQPSPNAVLKLMFWLLGVIPPRATLKLDSTPPSSTTIATAIRDAYEYALELDSNEVRWNDDKPDLATLPWEEAAAALFTDGKAQSLVSPRALGSQRDTITTKATDEAGSNTWFRRRTAANKVRLHVRVLFRIHQGLPTLEASGRFDRIRSEEMRVLVEDAIEDLITSAIWTVLLDRQSSYFGADILELHERAVKIVNRFSGDRRHETFRRWFRKLSDPMLLLSIAEQNIPTPVLEIAHARLRELFTANNNPLEREGRVPDIQRLATYASSAGEHDIASAILAFGDKCTEGHAMRAEWEATAFRARLMLAYHKRDARAVEQIPAPATSKASAEPFEFSRNFYRALILLDTQPDQAEQIFQQLESSRPGNAAVVANLFAARIRQAARSEENERPAAFARAVDSWRKVEGFMSETDRATVATSVSYNLLVAFDGAKIDDQFDGVWAALPLDTRCRPEFISFAVSHYRRLGKENVARDILNLARKYHARPDGSVPEDFKALERGEDQTARNVAPALEILPSAQTIFSNLAALSALTAEDAAQSLYGPKVSVADFLAAELCEASKVLLVRSSTLRDLRVEDKYSDMLGTFLEQRLVHFTGWSIKDQPRGGASAKGTTSAAGGVGERDLVILWRGGEVAIVEALRLTYLNRNEITKHVGKVPRYDLVGLYQAYVLVYYSAPNFTEFCEGYIDHVRSIVLPAHDFVSLDEHDPGVRSGLGAHMRVFRVTYRRSGALITVDHLILFLMHDVSSTPEPIS